MSKPDLDIIHSPEAAAFLRMVTAGFYDRSCTGLWLYEVIGREWDEMAAWSSDLKQEIFVQTCTWSIGIWEWVYGFEPDERLTLQERRQRILAKIIGTRPINPEVVRRGIELIAGVKADVTDFTAPYSFDVTLHSDGKVVPYEKVFKYISEIKPAHLSVRTAAVHQAVETTLFCGGYMSAHIRLPIPEQPDELVFETEVHTTGRAAFFTRLPVPEAAETG